MMSAFVTRSLVITWTGHRKGFDADRVVKAVSEVLDRMIKNGASSNEHGAGRVVGIGSVAVGSDTIVAEALQARRVPLIIHLPFELARFESDASPEQKARTASLIDCAKLVRTAPRQENDNLAYLEAGIAPLELADVLIAVWDGQPAAGTGGTEQVVAAARRRSIPVVLINPSTGVIEWPSDLDIPLNNKGGRYLRSQSDVRRVFVERDGLAQKDATPFRAVLFKIILAHLVAVAVAIIAGFVFVESVVGAEVEKTVSILAGLIKTSVLIWAFLMAFTYRQRQRQWLQARTDAELCRSFLAVWYLPRDSVFLPPAPIRSTVLLRRELELAWLLDSVPKSPLQEVVSRYLDGSHNDPANPQGRLNGQLAYFSREQTMAESKGRIIKGFATCCTALAILLSVIGVVMSIRSAAGHAHTTNITAYSIIKGLSIVLPLVTATMISLAISRDFTRRVSRFKEMTEYLEAVKLRIAAAPTWSAFGRAVTEAEWLLQAELAEWHAFARYAGAPHS